MGSGIPGITLERAQQFSLASAGLPRVVRLRQRRPDVSLPDPATALRETFRASGLAGRVPPGDVAIGVGSRGVANLAALIAALVDEVRLAGGRPFIVPAMGSHGASTAEGQAEVLAGYGVTAAAMGCPVRATMDVAQIARTENGLPVYMDAYAATADGVLMLSRVKPHTAFRAAIESGMAKMLAIGFGKLRGPTLIHAAGLAENLPLVAPAALAARPVLGGVAVVEDSHERTLLVEAAPAERMLETDRRLLTVAWEQLLRIPTDRLDVLIVDRIGKDLSGSGMDYNVIGMWRRLGGERTPLYRRIVALALSEGTHGNAFGIGNADFTTRRLVERIDYAATYANALTAQSPEATRVACTLPTDELAIKAAVQTAPLPPDSTEALRLAHIDSTLHLDELEVSEGIVAELLGQDGRLEQISDAHPLPFEADGRLVGVRA